MDQESKSNLIHLINMFNQVDSFMIETHLYQIRTSLK